MHVHVAKTRVFRVQGQGFLQHCLGFQDIGTDGFTRGIIVKLPSIHHHQGFGKTVGHLGIRGIFLEDLAHYVGKGLANRLRCQVGIDPRVGGQDTNGLTQEHFHVGHHVRFRLVARVCGCVVISSIRLGGRGRGLVVVGTALFLLATLFLRLWRPMEAANLFHTGQRRLGMSLRHGLTGKDTEQVRPVDIVVVNGRVIVGGALEILSNIGARARQFGMSVRMFAGQKRVEVRRMQRKDGKKGSLVETPVTRGPFVVQQEEESTYVIGSVTKGNQSMRQDGVGTKV
jgi:hypothetical protein